MIVIVDISNLSRDLPWFYPYLPWFYWGLPLFYSRTFNISAGARSHLRETGLRGEKIMGDSYGRLSRWIEWDSSAKMIIIIEWKTSYYYNTDDSIILYGLVVWNIFYFSIYWEQSSQLTNIFQRGWNHQPVYIYMYMCMYTSQPLWFSKLCQITGE